MKTVAWSGIATLWLGAAVVVMLAASGTLGADRAAEVAAEDDAYDFVVFASPPTHELLAKMPDDSRIVFSQVETVEEAAAALVSPTIDGIVLDSSTASEMPIDVLQAAYDQSYVIVAFEVRPSQILRGGCADSQPCTGNLHKDEPAIAYSRRTASGGFSAGETVVHPFSPETFHAILALRTDNARGLAR